MNIAIRFILICAVLFVLLELKNRKEKPYYQQLETANAELLEGCFVNDPVNHRRFMRALAQFANGRISTAQALFISTSQRVKTSEDKAACLYMASKALSQNGNDEQALVYAETALQLQPGRKHLRMEHARMLARNRNEKALEEFRSLVADFPTDAQVYHAFGNACILLENPTEAIIQLETALKNDPDCSGTRGLLMLANALLGDRETASMWCEEAAKHGEDVDQLRKIMENILNKEK